MDKTIRQLTDSYYTSVRAYVSKAIKDKRIHSVQAFIDMYDEVTEHVWNMIAESKWLDPDTARLVSTLSYNGDVIDEYEIELECDLADQFDLIRAKYAMYHDILDLLENENTYKTVLKVIQ